MNTMRHPMLCGSCVALCAVLTAVLPQNSAYSLLYLSLFLCCLLCPAHYGLLCALLSPLSAALLSGRVSGVQLLPVMAEGAAAALAFSALMKLLRTGKGQKDVLLSSVFSVLAGRAVNALVNTALFSRGAEAGVMWSWLNVLCAIPRIVFLLAALEAVYSLLVNVGFAEKRDR